MLPPFSCLSKCHPCGTQVVGHVLPCELGVPWAQHGPWLRPSAVTQPKIPPEMAERHNTKQILKLARDLVYKVQTLIENK
ncbi:hypothetical protein HGM15179_003999 [Zosterops borbonicus]|uniref:Uncharacterized protein n=1 Tax=Zosterops borbonicus TaxID=364589 RepID=A0A8K1D326_9PASS|nr:hypothetical protein HGM15179_022517 [Zosterops borbonicus]TRZ23145.1 hypothetical protein HGM15179_003999 [Zosterops borbonicus]